MNDVQQRAGAKHFAEYWEGKGYERGESQKFWLSLLSEVFGIEHPHEFIEFEDKIRIKHTNFIDAYIPSTKVLIEQKSATKNLSQLITQSDGSQMTALQQAQRYVHALLDEQGIEAIPRWIVVCNFEEFQIFDVQNPRRATVSILLKDLPNEYHRLEFLVKTDEANLQKEMDISVQAGELVGKLYDALIKGYNDPKDERNLKSLNQLCVRLVFCLYAEDAGIFGKRLMFHDYMSRRGLINARQALKDLFKVLDTKISDRDEYMEDDLMAFPYVNGGLFSDEDIVIPKISEEALDLLLNKASAAFDWAEISPTIFGAVFESTLNPETRRGGGMHYTSIENIHKVIDPLFLGELKNELARIKLIAVERERAEKLRAFQKKLASLKFLDPAAGSGNFLTESYLCLRRLENDVIAENLIFRQNFRRDARNIAVSDQISFGADEDDLSGLIQVSIGQFYGIEINDFAVAVARTALWIAESQMLRQTEDIVHAQIDFLPLKSYANIIEGNALRLDWKEIVSPYELNYIMGNPPFVGYSLQSNVQKADLLSVFVDDDGKPYKSAGKIDYVAGWYMKAAQFMQRTRIRAALVSTNSITQGEQVASIWKPLYYRFGIHIDFAHRTFRWDSEASIKAHVHCVIIGFSSAENPKYKVIYDGSEACKAQNINFYLIDAPDVFIESRTKPLSNVPQMVYGNKPTDGGYLFVTNDEYRSVCTKEPVIAKKYIRQIFGSNEYINSITRYCIWLVDASPSDIRSSAFLRDRVSKVKEFRLASSKEATRKSAETPTLFQEIRQPQTQYIIVPRHSSEARRYIPLGFVSPEIIVNDAVQIIPNATLYHFGVLTSNVHMAWMRAVCGRIKSDYRYSKDIVYNNFPWPEPTAEQKAKIEKTAQAILDARAVYPDSSLADLYDDLIMPAELRKAHRENDRAVWEAYGKAWDISSESECVAYLMSRYQELAQQA